MRWASLCWPLSTTLSRIGDPIQALFPPDPGPARYLAQLGGLAAIYVLVAKGGLALASVNPSATPIWPPTGLALAALLLGGKRLWPGVFAGAWLANVTTAGSLLTATAIAAGNSVEALIGAALVNQFCGGKDAFHSPSRVLGFFVISFIPTAVSATVGVGALTWAGFAPAPQFLPIWTTWWLGDIAGALVITPALVLWGKVTARDFSRDAAIRTGAILLGAFAVGIVSFSPLLPQTASRSALGFLAILPLFWAALYRGPRDTATVAVILSAFAIWATAAGGGPFAHTNLNDSFLRVLMFMISCSIPSLALSADAEARRLSEEALRRIRDNLDQRVRERTSELEAANGALQAEIAQREKIDAELRLRDAHLAEAQRFANLGSWTWNAQNGKVTWSDQLLQIYGLKKTDFGGTFEDFLKHVHADDRERVKKDILEAFSKEQPFRLSERIVRPNGEVRHLLSSGEIVWGEDGRATGMLGVCQDVTDRQMTETSLRITEEQYRLLVDSVRDYAIYMLDREGTIISWNIGASRIKGYSGFEIIGKSFSRFYTEDDIKSGLPQRALETAAREGKFEGEGWRVRKDGSRFYASVLLTAITNEAGELVGYAKVTRDITERLEAQKALEEAREQLAQAQKMEALGQLTGGIAHDFNNILMIASGHAQLLQRRLTDPRQLQAVDAIYAAASRGESLTRQLLAFARRQPLNPTVIDIGERIDAVREMLGSSLRGNIHLVSEISRDLWRTEVDLAEFELALVNIAVNARDAMPNGGTITLSAQNVTLRPLRVGTLRGDFVALRMSDTGTGIPPEVLPRIFDPFFTTKAVGKGTGLGLSQVYGFAKQSGGAATVESEVGRGTTITLYLPRSHAPLPRQDAEGGKTRETAVAQGTILAVEDNLDVADVTASVLEELGYHVVRAQNAADALDQMARNGRIDLVFSDIVMPGAMNGLSLAQEIATRYPDVPVVLTSGYSEAVQTAASAFPILRKPYEVSALEKLLREAMAKRAGRRDSRSGAVETGR